MVVREFVTLSEHVTADSLYFRFGEMDEFWERQPIAYRSLPVVVDWFFDVRSAVGFARRSGSFG